VDGGKAGVVPRRSGLDLFENLSMGLDLPAGGEADPSRSRASLIYRICDVRPTYRTTAVEEILNFASYARGEEALGIEFLLFPCPISLISGDRLCHTSKIIQNFYHMHTRYDSSDEVALAAAASSRCRCTIIGGSAAAASSKG
jgi:hypothetical protein